MKIFKTVTHAHYPLLALYSYRCYLVSLFRVTAYDAAASAASAVWQYVVYTSSLTNLLDVSLLSLISLGMAALIALACYINIHLYSITVKPIIAWLAAQYRLRFHPYQELALKIDQQPTQVIHDIVTTHTCTLPLNVVHKIVEQKLDDTTHVADLMYTKPAKHDTTTDEKTHEAETF